MPYYCTVPRCTSMAGKAKNVSFHQFPRDEELARLWNDILKRGKPYTKYSKVCSLHFKPEDYTITSVGKNKGQWRTLRKDAVPSQNLPSETPAPYSRKQWESWSQNSGTPVMDPSIHQHVAQAIYMQTMLAMQAAGTAEPLHHNGPMLPDTPHSSNHEDILKGKQTNTDTTSYKCTDCTKCFKDPDVFILHKRTHTKEKTNGIEKENFNMNLTLRSNPILANLLKTNSEANFDPSILTMENLLMTALAANIDYLRNFTTKDGECDENRDRIDLNHDRIDSNHRIDVNRDRIDLNHDRIDSNDRIDVNRDRIDLNQDRIDSNDRIYVNRDIIDLNHDRIDVNRDSIDFNPDKSENNALADLNHLKSELNYRSVELHSKSDPELLKDSNYVKSGIDRTDHEGLNLNRRGEINVRSDLSYTRSEENHATAENHDLSRGEVNCLSGPLSYAIDFTSKEIGEKSYGSYYKKGFNCEVNDEKNDNFNEACDNDLSESMDSNSLVIDESV